MDIQVNEKKKKMNEKSVDEDVQIVEARINKAFEKVVVKQEHPDEAEIRELAAKMVEANKAKMVNVPGTQQQQQRPAMCFPTNIPRILRFFDKRPADSSTGVATKPPPAEGKVPPDDESQRGRFGWTSFDDCHIPYIFRSGEKYCAVRILESKLLNKYLSYLHSDIYSCTCIRSYYITEAESKLLPRSM